MKILLVAATQAEIAPFLQHHGLHKLPLEEKTVGAHTLSILISGIGMVATTFSMAKFIANKEFDLAINVGIAGSFDPELKPGAICRVGEDSLAEFGVEDDVTFLNAESVGLGKSIFFASAVVGLPIYNQLKEVKAVSVNTVHGNEKSIAEFVNRLHPQIETMEGAAFFYCCEQSAIPGIQIRSISNVVEKRNRASWQLDLAINNLNETLIKLLES